MGYIWRMENTEKHCCHCESHSDKKSHRSTFSLGSHSSDPQDIFICPMHPEVRQVGPGSCPKCGMALESLIGDTSDDHELRDMLKRFWWAAIFTIPLFILSMGDMFIGHGFSRLISEEGKIWVEFILATLSANF